MNDFVNPAFEFEKQIFLLKANSRRILGIGIALIILFGLTVILLLNFLPTKSGNQGQGNNQIISQTVYPVPIIQSFLIILMICGTVFLIITIQIKKSFKMNNVIKSLYQFYGIQILDGTNGILKIYENFTLTLEWSSKGFFIIKKLNKTLSFATSSELYWKVIYYSYKYNARS